MSRSDQTSYLNAIRVMGRPITYYPVMAKALGSVKCGVFVSNFFYWEGKQHDEDGWMYKSQSEILDETGLSRSEQEGARKRLREFGALEEKKAGVPAKLYYRFNWNIIEGKITDFLDGKKVKKVRSKTLIYQLKELFDSYYMSLNDGNPFDWGSDKEGSKMAGKHWSGIKKLKTYFEDRARIRLKIPDEEKVPEDEIILAFTLFLDKIPDYWKGRCSTPMLMYSKINEIVSDIIKSNKNGSINKQKTGGGNGSTASEYID